MFSGSRQEIIPSFNVPGVPNLERMIITLKEPIAHEQNQNNQIWAYAGKKFAGTDVGHMLSFSDEIYMVKTGMSLGLLKQALERRTMSQEDKVKLFLTIAIVGNYLRVTQTNGKDPRVSGMKETIYKAFNAYVETPEGSALLAKIKEEKHVCTTIDIARIFTFFRGYNEELKDVLGLPAFADVTSGCFSQEIYNTYAKVLGIQVAAQKLLINPQGEEASILMASCFQKNTTGFDSFLLKPFIENENLEDAKAALLKAFEGKSLKGLASGILMRHIMGENADNSPDNMIINEQGEVIQIDLTGFRMQRQKDFTDPKGTTFLGWDKTLAANDADTLLARLFDSTVFNGRFVFDHPHFKGKVPAEQQKAVYDAIVSILKDLVRNQVVEEIQALRSFFSNLNPEAINEHLAKSLAEVYNTMAPELRPSKEGFEKLISFDQGFLATAIVQSKHHQETIEAQASASMSI